MNMHASDGGWRLAGQYSADSLLKIKQTLMQEPTLQNGTLDVSDLETINAPVIALMIEMRRRSASLKLIGCRDEFREMLKLYGVECIFQFA